MSDAPGQDGAGPQTQLPEPPPRPPLPPTPPERSGMRALLLSITGLMLLFFPVSGASFVGIALLIAGVVVGVRARRRARRILTRAPGALAGIVVGSVGLAVCVAALAVGIVVRDELSGYLKCEQAALTNTDKQICRDTYLPRIERKLHLPEGMLKNAEP